MICLRNSLFRSHNETMNIWTHLLGTLLFVSLIYITFAIPVKDQVMVNASIKDIINSELDIIHNNQLESIPRWPIIVFLFSAIICLGNSTLFHMFLCVSHIVKNILQTIDYCGIAILISGSYVPVIYYTFYCYPAYLKLHLITVIVLNIINVCIMATPTFRYNSISFILIT